MEKHTVEVKGSGEVHTAHYSVFGGLITVEYCGAIKKTEVGDTPLETLAKMMLLEMIWESDKQK